MALLASERVRRSARALYLASLLVVAGFVTHRLNVSVTGFEGGPGGGYVPAWTELLVTVAMVAAGFTAFALAVRYLPVYPPERETAPAVG
jgi:Ni/Fe-hydrogenase subunit HybB-like protein